MSITYLIFAGFYVNWLLTISIWGFIDILWASTVMKIQVTILIHKLLSGHFQRLNIFNVYDIFMRGFASILLSQQSFFNFHYRMNRSGNHFHFRKHTYVLFIITIVYNVEYQDFNISISFSKIVYSFSFLFWECFVDNWSLVTLTFKIINMKRWLDHCGV